MNSFVIYSARLVGQGTTNVPGAQAIAPCRLSSDPWTPTVGSSEVCKELAVAVICNSFMWSWPYAVQILAGSWRTGRKLLSRLSRRPLLTCHTSTWLACIREPIRFYWACRLNKKIQQQTDRLSCLQFLTFSLNLCVVFNHICSMF